MSKEQPSTKLPKLFEVLIIGQRMSGRTTLANILKTMYEENKRTTVIVDPDKPRSEVAWEKDKGLSPPQVRITITSTRPVSLEGYDMVYRIEKGMRHGDQADNHI